MPVAPRRRSSPPQELGQEWPLRLSKPLAAVVTGANENGRGTRLEGVAQGKPISHAGPEGEMPHEYEVDALMTSYGQGLAFVASLPPT